MGTGILVLFGCGAAVLTGDILLISLAFGFAIIVGAYTIGKISGCHVNPAVSLAMLINGKLSVKDFIGYVIARPNSRRFCRLRLALCNPQHDKA